MSNTITWRATWVDARGRRRELLFNGSPHRGIARIDFQLKVVERGEPLPGAFHLEEVVSSTDEETVVCPAIYVNRRSCT